MGWQPPRKVFRIEPTDGPYAGLAVRINGVPLGQFVALASLSEQFDATGKSPASEFSEIIAVFEAMAGAIVEWNLELPLSASDPDGPVEPVPTTIEGLNRLDFELVMWIFGQWIGAMGDIAAPLEPRPGPTESSSGAGLSAGLADLSRPLSPVPT